MDLSEADPKGLVRESYRIDGITLGECKSIFVDWALSLKAGTDTPDALRALIAEYGLKEPDHPMSGLLTEALVPSVKPTRRGGRIGRIAAGPT